MTNDNHHRHSPAEEREIREAALDKTIEDSFPASDPPSTNPNPDDHDALDREPPLPEEPPAGTARRPPGGAA